MSSSVRSFGAVLTIGAAPIVSVLPGRMIRRFVPSDANSPVTYARAPSPRLVSSTTEATPIATPSSERRLRSRWPRKPDEE
jgi:hypothetical protein